jgi:tetratricopeptide (TPR) repeat protein
MPVTHASFMPPSTVRADADSAAHRRFLVDLLAPADEGAGGLTVRWAEAPGNRERAIPADELARIGALARAVSVAESQRPRDADAIVRTRLELGRALYTVLDGPERALTRRCQDAAGRGSAPALAIRLRSADEGEPMALARHPAVHWRWELIADERGPLAARPSGLSLAVQLGSREAAAPRVFEHGGLRILFMAYSPEDTLPVLDFEYEEEHVQKSLAGFVRDGRVRLRVVEQGSLEALKQCLIGRTYDVVHLSGHGVLTPEGPRLLMEDEVGDCQGVSPDELLRVLRRAGRMPEVVMISSCHSAGSRDGTPSFAAHLVASGVPTVIGWVQPIRDDLATEAAADIYQRLCTGATPAEAVAFARRQLFETDQSVASLAQRTHAWGTLHLLTCAAAGVRVDGSQPALDNEPIDVNETYTYLGEGRMRVLASGFIGRRRPLQRLIRILLPRKEGEAPCAGAVILGMKGVGKSCLAGRAIQRLSQELDDPGQLGLVVLHGALDEAGVYEQFETLAVRWDDRRAENILNDESEPLLRRLRRLLTNHWKRRLLVIVLDDFEQNLDTRPEGHAVLKPAAAALLEVLMPVCRTSRARLLVTTTASFELNERDQVSLPVIRLGPFDPSSIRKMWNRGQSDGGGSTGAPGADGSLAGFSPSTWAALCDRLGRNPRILDWARTLIGGKSHDEVEAIVREADEYLAGWKAGAVPSAEEQNELARLFLRHMAYDRAVAMVSPDARTFIKRARVYETAVPARAFAALTEGLDVNLEKHLPALQNVGLLEVGELDGEPAHRVSPLVEPTLDVPDTGRWHAAAAAFWEADSQRSGRFGCVYMAWTHALAAQCQAIADRTGRLMHMQLNGRGLYRESLSLAEQHVRAFPESVTGHGWAGLAADRAGSPQRGWEYFARAELLAEKHGTEGLERAQLLQEAAAILHSLGRLGHARSRLERAIDIEQARVAGGTPQLAVSLYELARVLQAQDDLVGARELHQRSLAIHTTLFGTDEHPLVASSLNALAMVVQAQGDLGHARELLERALVIKTKMYETDEHPSVAVSLHALGVVLRDQGDLDRARELLERALVIKTTVYGTDEHREVAVSLHGLALVLRDQGDLDRARKHLERSLAIMTKVYGTDEHGAVAASLVALALVLQAQGDLDRARELLERSLAIQAKVYGTDEHSEVATSLRELALVLQAQGDLDRARELLERSLVIKTKVHGTDEHSEVAASLHALARVLQAQGDLGSARELYERLVSIMTKVCGTDEHIGVAALLLALARVLQAQGDLVGARQRLERSLVILTKLVGADEEAAPLMAGSLVTLALVLQAQGDLGGARERLERSLAISTKVYGTEEHSHVAASLLALARVLRAQGDLVGARQRFERSLAIATKLHGTDEHPSVAASLHELAEVLHAQGDLVGARERLERSVSIRTKLYGTDVHPSVAASLYALAGVLHAEGDLQGAIVLFRRVLWIQARCYGTLDHPHSAEAAAYLGICLLQEGAVEECLTFLVHAARVFTAQAPGHPMLAHIVELLGPLEEQASGQAVPFDVNRIASLALARRRGMALAPDDQTTLAGGLAAMAAARPPYDMVAAFLRAVADGAALPEVPTDLREDVARFLAAVAAAADSSHSDDTP